MLGDTVNGRINEKYTSLIQFWSENCNGRSYIGDLCVVERIILKGFLTSSV
jgi:hypothetical protein